MKHFSLVSLTLLLATIASAQPTDSTLLVKRDSQSCSGDLCITCTGSSSCSNDGCVCEGTLLSCSGTVSGNQCLAKTPTSPSQPPVTTQPPVTMQAPVTTQPFLPKKSAHPYQPPVTEQPSPPKNGFLCSIGLRDYC